MTRKRLWWWRFLVICMVLGGSSIAFWKQVIEEFLEEGGAIRIGFKTYGKGDPYP
jgi:hypothetical protein